jgi:Mg2+ and Co2+ transporter CorA
MAGGATASDEQPKQTRTTKPAARAKPVPRAKRSAPAKRSGTAKQAEGLRAFLYDAGAEDKEVDFSGHLTERLTKDQLLWVDVDLSSEAALEQLRTLVDLDDDEFSEEQRVPIREREEHVSFTILALSSGEGDSRLARLTCAVAARWVVTAHDGSLAFIDAFDEHVRADSSLGALDGPSFAASLLEWELNDFFLAVEAVQKTVDRLEERILGAEDLGTRSLDELVKQRRRLTYLRGGLGPHRYVYATLAHTSFDVASGSDGSADFAILSDRVEQAVQATEGAREMIVGAFDLYMTRTAQRTNDVMKVLTVISALLLPATVLAGVFGMNMLPDVFMHHWFFVVVIALMVVVSGGLLTLLYRRGWL